MLRVLGIIGFAIAVYACKKIDYQAVFAIDACKMEIESGGDILTTLTQCARDSRLPGRVQEHIKSKLLNPNDSCFSQGNVAGIRSFIEEIRQFLLYRTRHLPVSIICGVSPAAIYAHQLSADEPFYVTIHGIDLAYQDIVPRYRRNDQEVDITSLYCNVTDSMMTIQLGGPNGLPIDENVQRLIVGRNDDIFVPIYQATPNDLGLTYQTHVARKGWMLPVQEGSWTGTKGEGLRIESFRAEMVDTVACKIRYRVFQQDYGISEWFSIRESAGLTGRDKRIEAIMFETLNCPDYRLEYQGHIENVGDTEWVTTGTWLGDPGKGQRLEALRIKLVGLKPDQD